MSLAQSYQNRGRLALATLALLGAAGCAIDTQDEVRDQVGAWVALGDTRFFHSTPKCTAAVFDTHNSHIKSSLRTARSVGQGVHYLGQGEAIALRIPGLTPSDVSDHMFNESRTSGVAIVSAAAAARQCMTEDLERAFHEALTSQASVLKFDPEDGALAVFDRDSRLIYYARGAEAS